MHKGLTKSLLTSRNRGYSVAVLMNMTIISSSEVENVHFMSDKAMNEIYFFSLQEMKYKYMSYSWKKHFFFILYN